MTLQARIGGIVFDGSGPSGFVIGPDGWSGWDEGVAIRREETPRPNGHGVFEAPGYLGGRLIAISGHILGRTAHDTRNMAARLTGLLADGSRSRLTVETDAGVTWADVRLADQTQVTVWGSNPAVADFMVQFFARDPRRYGDTHTYAGPTAQTLHRGNFPASPIIEVTGSLPTGYQVASQGRQFNVTQALTSGQTHRLDMNTGRLYRNGVVQAGAVATAETFTIPPGQVTPVVFTPASGSGSMTVRVADTYV